MSEQVKNTRNEVGRVVSDKMDKSITVLIDRKVYLTHQPQYHEQKRRREQRPAGECQH